MKHSAFLLAAVLVLGGCAQSVKEPEPPVSNPVQETEAPVEATPETTPEATEEPAEPSGPVQLSDNRLEYLNGTWTLATNNADTNGEVVLEFDSSANTITITPKDGNAITANTEVFLSCEDEGAMKDDAIRFTVNEVPDFYVEKYGKNGTIFSSDMQFFTGTFRDTDYLLLRELGNGLSVIDSDVLKEENELSDHAWVFVRDRKDNTFPDEDQNEELKLKGGEYYALSWVQGDNSYLLQEVDAFEKDEDWYGENIHTFRPVYKDSEYANTIFAYNDQSEAGIYLPSFVKITVDDTGTVTSIHAMHYFGYGAYTEH